MCFLSIFGISLDFKVRGLRIVVVGVWFCSFSVSNVPLLSIHRFAGEHVRQVLPSQTAEGGDHRGQKGEQEE